MSPTTKHEFDPAVHASAMRRHPRDTIPSLRKVLPDMLHHKTDSLTSGCSSGIAQIAQRNGVSHKFIYIMLLSKAIVLRKSGEASRIVVFSTDIYPLKWGIKP